MITYKCSDCGGEMFVSRSGDLACPYCGRKANFSDAQLREYGEFRRRMLEYLRAVADQSVTDYQTEKLWESAETLVLEDENGDDITIRYIYESETDGIKMYCTRTNVLYVFPANKRSEYEKAKSAIEKITFPQADMKGLQRCFPEIAGTYELSDGGLLVALSKAEKVYPLAMFGSLIPQHVEWIISRLENIACVLEYSEMTHGKMCIEDVFINPATHEAALLGGWYYAKSGASHEDIKELRKVATKLLGNGYSSAPEALKEFLEGKPAADAFADFEAWDMVIEKGLGGRHFTKFEF